MIKVSCTNENLDFFALNTPLDLMKLVIETLCKTSGCPWPKATLKSPVGARDLGPL
jgi:hypothetical protein